jgi:hypothetical protein
MSVTGYASTGAFFNTGVGICRIHAEINYDWSRWDNTVTFNNTYARIKYYRESGSWTSFTYNAGWAWRLFVDAGVLRRSDTASGTRNANTTEQIAAVSVGYGVAAGTTAISARVGAWFSGDPETFANHTLYFGAAGAPSGMWVSASAVTDTTANLYGNVDYWGDYSSAGSGMRIEYWQEGQGVVNLAYNTGGSHTRSVTGLTPNAKYNLRNYANNGSGVGANGGPISFYTLSNVTETSKNVQAATADFVVTVAQGVRATTAKVQYRKVGDTTWIDSATSASGTPTLQATGLLPSTDYEYRYAVTTSDGTNTQSTSTFTTLPAAKLIMPDGSVKNAIPRTILPDGTVTMKKVKIL